VPTGMNDKQQDDLALFGSKPLGIYYPNENNE
jgi:hypothetical protein